MDYSVLLQKILLLVMIMAIGFISNKCGLLDSAFSVKLSRFLLNVFVPAMLLSAGLSSELTFDRRDLLQVGSAALFFLFFLIAVSYLLVFILHPKKEELGLYRFLGIFPNNAFFGYPVVAMVLGDTAVVYAAALSLPFTLLVFSVGPAILSGKKADLSADGLRSAVNPCTIASIVAVLLIAFPVRMPVVVSDLMKTLSNATLPLVFMIIGSNLATMKPEELFGKPLIYVFELFRRIAVPIAAYYLACLLFHDRILTGCMAILASVPAASSGILIVESRSEDPRPISEFVFKSTLLSIITIPAVLAILFW